MKRGTEWKSMYKFIQRKGKKPQLNKVFCILQCVQQDGSQAVTQLVSPRL